MADVIAEKFDYIDCIRVLDSIAQWIDITVEFSFSFDALD
ncbi:hypothetical protein FQV37_2138 [Psychrobacter nivimaris]|uniref:Uncharacterized protein n=1 Tax=Psychrobacter nivimaris TaxID=281738 RepID=A0A6N7BY56_9GAMM|nr:hypothetical protein FQV37_2138 [Psychrobacter nivimaris]